MKWRIMNKKYAVAIYNKKTRNLTLNAFVADNGIEDIKGYLLDLYIADNIPGSKKFVELIKKAICFSDIIEIMELNGCLINIINIG